MNSTLHLVTAPTRFPITLIQAKEQCRIDDNDHNAEIDALIEAVTSKYDGRDGLLGRALVQQTWELRCPYFPDSFTIPLPPCVSITSVKYLDTSYVEQTVSSSVYVLVDQGFKPAILQLQENQTWPSATLPAREDAVRVRFVAGYASVSNEGLSGTIPRAILNAMLLEVEQLYDGHDAFESAIVALRTPYIASWF